MAVVIRHFLLVLCFILIGIENKAQAKRRVALVIGNSNYEYAPKLSNTTNDAEDLGSVLVRLKFDVTLKKDVHSRQIREIIQDFSEKLTGSETVLFFYAGHAMQVQGMNYLAPIDLQIGNERDLINESLSLGDVLSMIGPRSRRLLIFLDACRDNPLKIEGQKAAILDRRKDGLARESISNKDTLIAFSTEPGNVALDGAGRNSPFAAALLDTIAQPGIEVSELMTIVRRKVFEGTRQKQLPWTNSSLLSNFYFNPKTGEQPHAPGRIGETEDPAALLAAANEFFAARSFAQAAEHYHRAAKLGVVRAMTAYGNLLARGIGIATDDEAAQAWYLKAAKLGDADAQFLVGRNYERGTGGVPKDLGKAVSWYTKAALAGNSDAMNNLAVMNTFGEGVEPDFKKAVHWYKRAADAGNGNAMFNLGALYDDGKGVELAPELAAKWVIRSILAKIEAARLEMQNNSAAWSLAFRKAFQTELKNADLYSGAIDGSFGPGTQQAIAKLK